MIQFRPHDRQRKPAGFSYLVVNLATVAIDLVLVVLVVLVVHLALESNDRILAHTLAADETPGKTHIGCVEHDQALLLEGGNPS